MSKLLGITSIGVGIWLFAVGFEMFRYYRIEKRNEKASLLWSFLMPIGIILVTAPFCFKA